MYCREHVEAYLFTTSLLEGLSAQPMAKLQMSVPIQAPTFSQHESSLLTAC